MSKRTIIDALQIAGEYVSAVAVQEIMDDSGKWNSTQALRDLNTICSALSTPTPDQRGLSEEELKAILYDQYEAIPLEEGTRRYFAGRAARAIIDRLTASHAAGGRSYAEGIEAAAKLIDKRRTGYEDEHGFYDPSTGVTEYPGNGDEYVAELEEIAEAIRTISPKPTTQGGG